MLYLIHYQLAGGSTGRCRADHPMSGEIGIRGERASVVSCIPSIEPLPEESTGPVAPRISVYGDHRPSVEQTAVPRLVADYKARMARWRQP